MKENHFSLPEQRNYEYALKYLGQIYHIALPDIEISAADNKVKVPLREKVLMLHYPTRAKGSLPTDDIIVLSETIVWRLVRS